MTLEVKQLVKNMEKAGDPVNQYVNLGIIEPDGTKRYVCEKGSIWHKFSLDQIGKYRMFVENKNDGAVDVEGSYIVR